jgi:hypothetical protein
MQFPMLPDARDRLGQAGTPRCSEEKELKAIERKEEKLKTDNRR